jgi:hypothetical protein
MRSCTHCRFCCCRRRWPRSHFLIDRYRLARYVAFAKNKVTGWNLKWADCSATGFPRDVPPATAFWLMILIDNTMHLSINYASLRWL